MTMHRSTLFRQSMIIPICSFVASTKRGKSSAKNMCDKGGLWGDIFKGFHLPSATAWMIECPNLSMHCTKRYGLIGSPYPIPLEGLKHFEFLPFQAIDILLVSIQLIIFLVHDSGRPTSSRVSLIKLHEIRS